MVTAFVTEFFFFHNFYNSYFFFNVYFDSKGTGDLNIKVYPSSRITLIQTYSIEDCVKYWPDSQIDHYNNMEIDMDLPVDFEIDFGMYSTAPTTGTSIGLLSFNNSSGVWCGKGSSSSRSVSFNGTTLNNINANTQYDYKFQYQNGTATFKVGESSISSTISITKLYSIVSRGGTHINYVKIKPL